MMVISEDNVGNLVYSVSMYRFRRLVDIFYILYLKLYIFFYFRNYGYVSYGFVLSFVLCKILFL